MIDDGMGWLGDGWALSRDKIKGKHHRWKWRKNKLC